MAFVYFVFFALICSAKAVLPNYNQAIQADGLSRDEMIEKYFYLGLSNAESLGFIACELSWHSSESTAVKEDFEKKEMQKAKRPRQS